MLGGYQILDLRNIDLSRSTSEASITDVEVLKQLSQIANHIQTSYDFNKPLHNQLKPLLIRYRDKKVGEKHEVACYGNIEVINTYYKFRIIAKNEVEQLTINVEFEEKTDEYSNKYWGIKTAKILLTTNVNINGDLTANSIIEKMEGYSVELVNNTGYTFEPIYAGAVKNGNKLTLVFAWNYTKTADATNPNPYVIKFNVPSNVADKLYPTLVSGNPVLDIKTLYGFSDLANSVAIGSWAEKSTNQVLLQLYTNAMVLDTKYYVRYEVTFLLSDNLIPQE